MQENEVTIVGGGLAGLTAGIHLSKIGIDVTIIEKNTFPKHKVCGEYISNEVLPYFKFLDIDIDALHPSHISKLHFSTQNGQSISTNLPLGGFGISRYVLDQYLANKAIQNGCKIITDTVENIDFQNDAFTIKTSNNNLLCSKIVIGAFGKRSNIDQKLSRSFIQKKSNWLAVKAHYSGDFDDHVVGLHNFEGGYCGVSKIENNKVNVCYLADFETFKNYKSIDDFQKNILIKNPFLKQFLQSATMLFEKPITISQISFSKKKAVENHIFMIGDTAGLIHPLCGNGMAMAIHSAKIISELIESFYKNDIKTRANLESEYQKKWNYNFNNRLRMGRNISNLLQKPKLAAALLRILCKFPFILPVIIKKTHGKLI